MQLLLLVLCVTAGFMVVMLVTGAMISGPSYKGPPSDHFDGSRFINPGGVKAKGVVDLFRWMLNRKRVPWEPDNSDNYQEHPLAHFKDGIRVTFVNHSTFLIQVDGVNILTDPVWSKRVSPFSWIGPRRMRAPGVRLEDLPRIHVVLLTHNHYDHLDVASLRVLMGGHHPQIIVPLGVRLFLDSRFIRGASELDWWQSITPTLDGEKLEIQAVPAQHFSGRGMLDRDATLWCGYVIKTGCGNIYFAGDTGYNDRTFKEIGARCGPISLSMIPIGAYKPGWFMEPVHVSPEQSLYIHRDVGSRISVPMHYGTFPLADDGRDDPVDDLRKAMQRLKLSDEEIVILKEGRSRNFEAGELS